MQISPKLSIAIKIVLTLANAIGNGSLALTGIVSTQQATSIALGCQFLVAAIGIGMSAFSSSAPGPLAPADPPVVVAAKKVADLPADALPRDIVKAKSAANAAVANVGVTRLPDGTPRP